jgi:hypothetical protein
MPSLTLMVLLAALAAPLTAQDTASARKATVTYRAGDAIYIGAGRADGLVEGQEVELLRGDSTVAILKVVYLASHQASCEVVRGASDAAVGDVIRFTPRTVVVARADSIPARGPVRQRFHGPGLHGRVGLRYFNARDGATGAGTSQPSLDLRLDGSELAGAPVGLMVDLRTRRTATTRGDGLTTVDGRTRVYQAALFWHPAGDRLRLVLGRQYLGAVTSVSLFDGALAEWRSGHLTAGGFGGVEPEPDALGLSSAVQDFGGYVQWHSRAGNAAPWSLTTGAVGSYTQGHANREFGFAQLSHTSRAWSLYALQELDYYRPWKVSQGESALSPTSTYVSTSLRPASWLALSGAYDNRRRVRLYRDAVDPLTAFDDAYRRGAWGGLTLTGRRVRVGGELRFSDGVTVGRATGYGATFGLDRLTPLQLSLAGRATWYRNPSLDGRLFALRLGADPTAAMRLELSGGIRVEDNPLDDPSRRRYQWYGLDVDLNLGRRWFGSVAGQVEHGPDGNVRQLFTSLAWRF